MNKIIVFGVNFHTTLGLIRGAGEAGYLVDLLMEPGIRSHCYVRYSKYVNRVHWLEKTSDALDVLRKEYWNEKEKPIIMCSSDASISLLDNHYEELKDHFHIFNAKGEQRRINIYMDKINTFPLAEEAGIQTIKTWLVTGGGDIPTDICYPCFTKGNNSTSSNKNDIHICNNKAEIEKCLRPGVEYLVQEYIQKDYELDIIGFAYNQGKFVVLPAVVRKIRDYVDRQSQYIRLDDIKDYPNVDVEAINRLVALIGYEGIFSVEFLAASDKYYFLEINLRNDACGYVYTAAGLNYPKMWIEYCRGMSHEGKRPTISFKTPYYMMQEGDLYSILNRQVSLLQWLKDFHKCNVFFTFNKKDLNPFLHSTIIHARQALKKLF